MENYMPDPDEEEPDEPEPEPDEGDEDEGTDEYEPRFAHLFI